MRGQASTPDDLSILAEKYGSDKCPAIAHSYTPEYNRLLSPLRDSIFNVLEVGIGNDELMIPIVGRAYRPGASLRMWRDYFPNADIYGCDILPSVLFQEYRIKTFLVDQSSEKSLNESMESLGKAFDLIVDDGSHVDEHMRLSFRTLWPYVRPKGIYIIEDVKQQALSDFAQLAQLYGFTNAECLHVYHGKNDWDGFVAFRKV
jgi:demethylmacrocin O-methyltransferase